MMFRSVFSAEEWAEMEKSDDAVATNPTSGRCVWSVNESCFGRRETWPLS
jgi:hypothetical protein